MADKGRGEAAFEQAQAVAALATEATLLRAKLARITTVLAEKSAHSFTLVWYARGSSGDDDEVSSTRMLGWSDDDVASYRARVAAAFQREVGELDGENGAFHRGFHLGVGSLARLGEGLLRAEEALVATERDAVEQAGEGDDAAAAATLPPWGTRLADYLAARTEEYPSFDM